MKASIKFATALILAAGAVAGSINVAHAGAGGSAGTISAQFTVTGNNLTGTAGAVAVGKLGAVTSGTATPTELSATAAGYAGDLTITNFSTDTIGYGAFADALLGDEQKNNFAGTLKSSVNLVPGPTTGVKLQ
jgi:hypothetical protein